MQMARMGAPIDGGERAARCWMRRCIQAGLVGREGQHPSFATPKRPLGPDAMERAWAEARTCFGVALKTCFCASCMQPVQYKPAAR